MINNLTDAQVDRLVLEVGEETIHHATRLVDRAGGGAKDLMDVIGKVGHKLAPWEGPERSAGGTDG